MSDLKEAKEILRKPRANIGLLNAPQLNAYYNHRVSNLVRERLVLYEDELEYLLGETGNGALRFDLSIIRALNKKELLIADKRVWHGQDIEKIKRIKGIAHERIKYLHKNPTLIREDITKYLLTAIGSISYESSLDGYVGEVGSKSFIIHFDNGWVEPNDHFVAKLKKASSQKLTPIFISRKVHGTLFPLMKTLGIGGFNTYASLADKVTLRTVAKANEQISKEAHPYLPHTVNPLRYHGPFSYTEDYFEGAEALRRFLESFRRTIIEPSEFSKLNLEKVNNFQELLAILKRSKLKTVLTKSAASRSELLQAFQE